MVEMRTAYDILIGKPKGTGHLGRNRRRYEDNIKMDLRGIEWEGVDFMYLAQDKDQWRANTVMKLQVQ
jgi:hypothetical protein